MRKLTKKQIERAISKSRVDYYQITSVIIVNLGARIESSSKLFEKDYDVINMAIKSWLKKEMEDMPEETRQHLNYLTCHPTLIVKFSIVKP